MAIGSGCGGNNNNTDTDIDNNNVGGEASRLQARARACCRANRRGRARESNFLDNHERVFFCVWCLLSRSPLLLSCNSRTRPQHSSLPSLAAVAAAIGRRKSIGGWLTVVPLGRAAVVHEISLQFLSLTRKSVYPMINKQKAVQEGCRCCKLLKAEASELDRKSNCQTLLFSESLAELSSGLTRPIGSMAMASSSNSRAPFEPEQQSARPLARGWPARCRNLWPSHFCNLQLASLHFLPARPIQNH